MKADVLRKAIAGLKSAVTVHTSDGKQVYVDNIEQVLVSEDIIAIGCGWDSVSGLVREIVLLSPDHVVRVEPTKRRSFPAPA